MTKRATRLLLVVGLLTVAADQGTKYLAVSQLTHALDGREGWARLEGFLTEENLDNHPARPGGADRTAPAVRFVEDYWHFRYVENPGAAWGLFGTLPDSVRAPFFHVVSLSALGFILWLYVRLGPRERLARLALALVAGGALGNFIDRALRGYVIDFIDWHWRNQPGMRWPTFNVADSAICVGVALMLADGLRLRRPSPGAPRSEGPESVAAGGRVV